jgi:hypothetical protein
MKKKTKAFDCVEFKRQAQERIRADWEAHKDEFGSYGEFLRARIAEDPWASKMMARFAKKEAEAGTG